MSDTGNEMHRWATDLFPINRSITGDGVRETLEYLGELLPGLEVHSAPTGTKAFDWEIPKEWRIRSAKLIGPDGRTVADFAVSNLHVLGYSIPVDQELSLEELDAHLYSLPDQPDAIPYVTSYYKPRWGFCLPHNVRQNLPSGLYHAKIDSELFDGEMNFGEVVIHGESDKEVFLSTYVCHPSMANNELSGPVVTTAIAKWLMEQEKLRYTYRIAFIPETIGALLYLSQNLAPLKARTFAGYNITCVGDERRYSYLPSRNGATLSDNVAKHVLNHRVGEGAYDIYSWLDRGSDERQYCAPGVDLPIASIMRSKYGTYPEYHTSLDDLTLVTPDGLAGAFEALRDAITIIERNHALIATVLGEPQMGKRNLYPDIAIKREKNEARLLLDVLSYCDGRSLLETADALGMYALDLVPVIDQLNKAGLVRLTDDASTPMHDV